MDTFSKEVTTINKIIFLDMDGLVSDFDGYANRELGIESKPGFRFSQDDWYRLREFNERIYRDIPMLPGAEEFVKEVEWLAGENGYVVRFLTAVPRENDLGWSFWDKTEWAREHFPGVPVWFGPYSDNKQQHYKPGCILIDDRVKNIDSWPKHGILHQGNYQKTLNTLEQIIKETN
jgi:5'(3')-deoxyribonucleotidase